MLVLVFLIFGSMIFRPSITLANKQAMFTIRKAEAGEEVNEEEGYFDLLMSPEEKREIKLELFNPAKEDLHLTSEFFTAYTNRNGEIEYNANAESYDESLKVKLTDVIKTSSKEVKIPKESKVVVAAEITLPKDIPSGEILGSWQFKVRSKKKQEGIGSIYTITQGIKITVDEKCEEVNVNLLDVWLNPTYPEGVIAKVQNDQPMIVEDVEYEGYITKKDSQEPLYQISQKKKRLAPNSYYDLLLKLDEQLTEGVYTYNLKVTTPSNEEERKEWTFTKDFVVYKKKEKTKKEVDERKSPNKTKKSQILYPIVLGIGIFSFLLFIVGRIKKRKESERKCGATKGKGKRRYKRERR